MTDLSGTCQCWLASETTMNVPGQARQLGVSMVTGLHAAPDTPWDGARLTYVGTSDVGEISGTQRGYFYNVHADGAISEGTFEAAISIPDGVIEGIWSFTGGTGSLAGITGGGSFKVPLTQGTTSEM